MIKNLYIINYIKSKKKINKNDFVKYRITIINETNIHVDIIIKEV